VRLRSALLLLALGATTVRADGLRGYVTGAFDAQLEIARTTRETVDAKRDDLRAARARRARAAYKLLRAGSAPAWVEPEERMATARRRAAARWLLARDRREEALLADEAQLLAADEARLVADRATAETAPLPDATLARPVRGTIARRFGPFVHDRSKATLTRHGLDFEVAADAPVRPVAAGTVLYAGPIRGLDDGLVIDHGGFISVLGKLAPTSLHVGDAVAAGETIARPARRRVYLEVRVPVGPGGVPVDPELLFEPGAP